MSFKDMRILLISAIVIFAGIFCSKESYAQSAYDSACYFPHMGDPNELDTIYGGRADQALGKNIALLPPLNGQTYDRLVMQGLPGNIPYITSVETGPTFNLHKLNFIKRYPYLFENWGYSLKSGHFRNSKEIDLISYQVDGATYNSNTTIYWADKNGDYDTGRYTQIFPFRNDHLPVPYIGKFTSDTVDDIIMSISGFFYHPGIPDTSYIALIKGGQQLYDKRIALFDDTVFYEIAPWHASMERFPFQGDWRGVGREDILMVDKPGNIFYYYKNDPPFELHRFVNAMEHDTILDAREWSYYKDYFSGGGDGMAMKAFPKLPSDHSFDLLCPLPASVAGISKGGICVFKGGPDFGSKRLSYNTPDYLLHSPAYYSGDFAHDDWPGAMTDCGDLTKTGNPVLATRGGYFTYGFTAFYVLGKAMDDKIDAFFSQNEGGFGGQDTIHAFTDQRTTYIMSAPAYESPEDQNNGIFAKGSLQVLYGSEKIPVHLNPKFAVAPIPNNDIGIEVYPNPMTRSFNITAGFDFSQSVRFIIRDVLGRGVYSADRIASGGEETFHFEIPALSSGTYFIQAVGRSTHFQKKISITE